MNDLSTSEAIAWLLLLLALLLILRGFWKLGDKEQEGNGRLP